MRAIVITKPGGPEVLELKDVPDPVPSRGEVLVRVRATAVNRADLMQRMGMYPAPADAPADIPGLEFAGDVEAVGPGVTKVAPGARVFGLVGGGAYAERIVAPARAVARLPEGMSYVEGAAVPEAFITAYDAMVTQAGLASGDVVLVHAAGSGVGTAAIQLARALGARSIGTARTADKLERAGRLGLDEAILVKDGRFADEVSKRTGGRGFDVALELVGGKYVEEDLACAGEKARIVLVGLMAGTRADLDLAMLLRKRVRLLGTVLRARPLEEKIDATRVFEKRVVPLFASGALVPIVDRVMKLAEAREAHVYVASNEGFGKVVLTV